MATDIATVLCWPVPSGVPVDAAVTVAGIVLTLGYRLVRLAADRGRCRGADPPRPGSNHRHSTACRNDGAGRCCPYRDRSWSWCRLRRGSRLQRGPRLRRGPPFPRRRRVPLHVHCRLPPPARVGGDAKPASDSRLDTTAATGAPRVIRASDAAVLLFAGCQFHFRRASGSYKESRPRRLIRGGTRPRLSHAPHCRRVGVSTRRFAVAPRPRSHTPRAQYLDSPSDRSLGR